MKHSFPRISAKCSISTVEQIEKSVPHLVKLLGKTKEDVLDMWLRSIIGGICNSTEEILREKSRIRKLQKVKRRILSVLNKGASSDIKEITNRFYFDLLQSAIIASRQKMRSKL